MPSFGKVARSLTAEARNLKDIAKFVLNRKSILESFERTARLISIEATNICNADCVFCAYQYQKRPQGTMSTSTFERVLDQYCEIGGGIISFTPVVGDALVDPQLVDRIRRARSRPEITHIGLVTNLILLERFGAEALVDSGISSVTVSVSGLDKEMYERVYRSKMYPKVLRNIKAFARANAARGNPVDFNVAMRIDRPLAEVSNYPDYLDVVELLGPGRVQANLTFDNWGGKVSQADLIGTMTMRDKGIRSVIQNVRRPRISPCTMLYGGPQIFWDGKVGGCGCRDVDADALILGNINETHLGDIILGEAMRNLRASFMNGTAPEICQKCTLYSNVSTFLSPEGQEIVDELARRKAKLASWLAQRGAAAEEVIEYASQEST